MKIFLTGASGLVGSSFAGVAARCGHEVIGAVGNYAGAIQELAAQCTLDLTDSAATKRTILAHTPEAIVNCAALSAPEACDANPLLAHALNVALPATLAQIARQLGCRLVHVSSEQVFDGARSTPYAAADPVSPINLYGRQKVESEHAVHTAAPFAVTVRAPLLMGNSLTRQRSVHERLFLDWSAGRTPKLFLDEFRQPCTAANLASTMLEICGRKDLSGIFHWAGADVISRHALGVRIREHFKLTEKQAPIASVTHAEVPGIAGKRQPRLALDVAPLAAKLQIRSQTVSEQLAELTEPFWGRNRL